MRKKFVLIFTLCFCLCLSMLPVTVFSVSTADAVEPVDTSADCSLSLYYGHDSSAFPELYIQLYRVASVSADFQYTLTNAFKNTGLTLNGIEAVSEWNAVRTTLESYITAGKLTPDRDGKTNIDGVIKFDNLEPGMYFIMPVSFYGNENSYTFDSVIVAVPGLYEDGTFMYDVSVSPKSEIETPTGEEIEYKVVKLWRDNGSADERPSNVEVDIICNGKVVNTVILSEENNWVYSWTAVDNGDTWRVLEKNVPDGYTMTIEEHSSSFTIINSISDISVPPQTGDTANYGLYIMLMCLSGLVLIILGTTAKRKAE